MLKCSDCVWSDGKFSHNNKVACKWLQKNYIKLPPYLGLYDIDMFPIATTIQTCFPKTVDESTAEECKVYQEK